MPELSRSTIVQLRCGDLCVEIAPAIGAAITAFYKNHSAGERFDYLRPASVQAIATGAISEMASFVMAPWAGRIRDGRFSYQGREIHYPSVDPYQPHSLHGFVRDQAWVLRECQPQASQHESSQENELSQALQNVSAQSAQHTSTCAYAILDFTHQATAEWPFSFTLEQTIHLSEQGLRIELVVRNQGEESMPFGFGHHPFYPCDVHTLVQAQVAQAWQGDHEVMPIALIDHPAQTKLAQGLRVQEEEHDTVFVGWQHEARISWPAQQESLIMQASAPQDFFVLYAPANQAWFCAEPFANVTDSFNLRGCYAPELIGGMDIAPGQGLTSWFSLRPGVAYTHS